MTVNLFTEEFLLMIVIVFILLASQQPIKSIPYSLLQL